MIHLSALELANFRGIQSGRLDDLTDVNILIGPNNSGKSTVGEAIAWAFFWLTNGNARDPLGISPLQGFGQRDQADSLWYRQDKTKTLKVSLDLTDSQTAKRSGFEVSNVNNQVTISTRLSENAHVSFGVAYAVFRPSIAANNHAIEVTLWPKLLGNRRDKTLTQSLNVIYNLNAEGFQLLPDQKLLVLFPEFSLPIELQGDGTCVVFRCLTVLSALQNTLFFVEEPECFQHPASLKRFVQALCSQARKLGIQLLLSTHSAECMDGLLSAAKEAGSKCAVYHLSLRCGSLETRRFEIDAAKSLEEQGVDLRCLDLYV